MTEQILGCILHIFIKYMHLQDMKYNTEVDPDIFKRGVGGALCWPPWLAGKENQRKNEVTLENISFWQNTSISIFKFSPFLSKKSSQCFKIY